jgi:small-conductance mechanosensitive channel
VPFRRSASAIAARRASNWAIGVGSGLVAVAALIVGSAYGKLSSKQVDPKIISVASALVLVASGLVATQRLSAALSHLATRRSIPAARGAIQIVSAGVGYLFVLFSVLAVLDVSIEKLLVGAGLAGVVLGIAAQQSLGNVFAGVVLLLARPFGIGDHIRIRSGALGGIFEAWVLEMSLTYVTLQTDDGMFKIPNSAMLAAGVGQLPLSARKSAAPPAPAPPAAAPPAPAPPAPAPAPPSPATSDESVPGGQVGGGPGPP